MKLWKSLAHAVLRACRHLRSGWSTRFRRAAGRTTIHPHTPTACLRVDSTPALPPPSLPFPWPESGGGDPAALAAILADQLDGRAAAVAVVVQGYGCGDRLHLVSVMPHQHRAATVRERLLLPSAETAP